MEEVPGEGGTPSIFTPQTAREGLDPDHPSVSSHHPLHQQPQLPRFHKRSFGGLPPRRTLSPHSAPVPRRATGRDRTHKPHESGSFPMATRTEPRTEDQRAHPLARPKKELRPAKELSRSTPDRLGKPSRRAVPPAEVNKLHKKEARQIPIEEIMCGEHEQPPSLGPERENRCKLGFDDRGGVLACSGPRRPSVRRRIKRGGPGTRYCCFGVLCGARGGGSAEECSRAGRKWHVCPAPSNLGGIFTWYQDRCIGKQIRGTQ